MNYIVKSTRRRVSLVGTSQNFVRLCNSRIIFRYEQMGHLGTQRGQNWIHILHLFKTSTPWKLHLSQLYILHWTLALSRARRLASEPMLGIVAFWFFCSYLIYVFSMQFTRWYYAQGWQLRLRTSTCRAPIPPWGRTKRLYVLICFYLSRPSSESSNSWSPY